LSVLFVVSDAGKPFFSSQPAAEYSIEFELDIPLDLFVNRTAGIQSLFQFMQNVSFLYPVLEMKLQDEGELVYIFETHYDTLTQPRLLDSSNVLLRYRSFFTPNNTTPFQTYSYLKFVHRIPWYVSGAPIQCAWELAKKGSQEVDPVCNLRLEQDVHQNFTRFSYESRIAGVMMPVADITLAEVAKSYPGITSFNEFTPQTVLGAKTGRSGAAYYYRTENIDLEIGGYTTDTTIDLVYDSQESLESGNVAPNATELSIRLYGDMSNDPPFSTHVVRRVDFLYYMLLNSQFNSIRDSNKTFVDSTQWGTFWTDL